MRLVLDAEVQGGKTHPAKYSLPGLRRLLKALAPEKRPKLVRGDSAFGNDPVMTELESIGQMYLTKLRQTAGVKRLIERNWSRQDWQDVGQGSEAVEAQLKLSGWSHARRVVVVRSASKTKLTVVESVKGKKAKRQEDLDFDDTDPVKRWDYAVLVNNSNYELKAIGQLYRDRADCVDLGFCQNGFDELKNQWGWGGYTTQDLERCNLSARAVALIYNWWSWYVLLRTALISTNESKLSKVEFSGLSHDHWRSARTLQCVRQRRLDIEFPSAKSNAASCDAGGVAELSAACS